MRLLKPTLPTVAVAGVGVATIVALLYGQATARLSGSQYSASGTPQWVGEGQMSLPLDAYHLSAHETAERINESNVIARSCMKSFGIDYLTNVSNITAKVEAGFGVNDSRRYGLTDPSAAKTYGYHLPTPNVSVKGAAARPYPDIKDLSPQQRQVLRGDAAAAPTAKAGSATAGSYRSKPIPQGGCLGVTDKVLHNPVDGNSQASVSPAELQREDYLKTQSDPKVLAAFQTWSRCMATHHYYYPNPISAATDPRWNMKKLPTRQELATAAADLTCKKHTYLIQIEYQVETALQNASIKDHADALAPLKSLVTAQRASLQSAITTYGT